MTQPHRVWSCCAFVLVATAVVYGQAPAIDTIEINQAIGVQKNGARKFAAGKDTVVRALLASPVTVDPGTTSATVTRDGTLVATLSPNSYRMPTSAVDFACPSRQACGNWAAGSYTFEVTVNGATSSTTGTTYQFVERRPLRFLAVPVKANYGGTVTQVAGDAWKRAGQYVRAVYPVAFDKFGWTVRAELDASASKFDLETDDGRRELWVELTQLMPYST